MKENNHKSFLAFSFAAGFNSPHIPIATFTQGDAELNFILDTGADDNVISSKILENIKYEKVEYQGTLAGVGGVFDVEACIISFQKDDDTFTSKFIVSDHLEQAFNDIRKIHAIPLHGILGSKFFQENNLVLDFKNFTAYNKKE